MRKKDKVNLIKLMISLSFVVIFSGLAFDFDNVKKLINPEVDTYVVSSKSSNGGMISITTSSGKQKHIKKNESVMRNYPTKTNVNNNDPNNELRNSIQKKYGINIKYGAETDGYEVANLTVTSLTDSNTVKAVLNELDKNLGNYPAGLFKEIKNSGFDLTIYLIERYNEHDVTGITDSTGKKVIISLATANQFNESIHHELYHYMERFMYSKGIRYTTWNSLNPEGFKYGNTNSSLSFNNTELADAFFVNNYAQTSPEEDRASTFEYMTVNAKEPCMDNGKPIWLKAKYMCEQIDIAFNSVNANTIEYWERYVY